jgi:hypothetical protein
MVISKFNDSIQINKIVYKLENLISNKEKLRDETN